MKRLTLLYDRLRWYEKAIIDAAERKGVKLRAVDVKDSIFDITNPMINGFGPEDVILQRCISYFRGLYLTAILENEGVQIINSFHVARTCGDKLLTTMALTKAKVPTPRTVVSFTPEAAIQSFEKIGYPALIKPIFGSWGNLIVFVNEKNIAKSIIEHRESMGPLYQIYYVQEEIKRPPRDIRTFVIGEEVVGAIYRVAQEGEKLTNTARGGIAVPCEITSEIEEISLKAAEAVGGGVLGIDLMESPDGLVCHEVNHVMEFRNTVEVTHIDIPGLIVDYVIDQAKK